MNQLSTETSKPPAAGRSQIDFVLLDGSGSMSPKWMDSLIAIQSYVDVLKEQNINSSLLVQVFDTFDLEYIARDCAIADWKDCAREPFGHHGGSTPLYDAINLMGRRLRDLDPPRCSIVIVTDGHENASRFTTHAQAKAVLDWCRAKGWQITFIGAEFDNASQAKLLGATKGSMIGVSKANLKAATQALGMKRARYGLYGEAMHYTDGEQQQFGGYLAGPSA